MAVYCTPEIPLDEGWHHSFRFTLWGSSLIPPRPPSPLCATSLSFPPQATTALPGCLTSARSAGRAVAPAGAAGREASAVSKYGPALRRVAVVVAAVQLPPLMVTAVPSLGVGRPRKAVRLRGQPGVSWRS